MAEDAYEQTSVRNKGVTDVKAVQYNSLMAECKAAAEGIPTHDIDLVIAYNGFKIDTITGTDNSPAGDAGFDITFVATYTYTGFKVTQIAWVFNAGELNFTMTEVFTYTGFKMTAVARTLS